MPATVVTPAFIGVDWGTTHRRAVLVSSGGEVLAACADGEGALASAGRFQAALETLLARWPQLPAGLPVVMSGMVGSASGWQAVPYLEGGEGGTPLSALASHLVPVADAPAGRRWFIVPGVCLHGAAGAVDVMRGEETQLFGALQLLGAEASDGCYVLPGTHGKWVRLAGGRVVELRTYMTGELFALLGRHGTLASAMRAAGGGERAGIAPSDPAFLRGVDDAASAGALSHALFGARARVVTGGLAPEAAAAYVSGLLVGAEWADARLLSPAGEPVRVIGEPALAALHAACAARHGRRLEILDAAQVQRAAWNGLAREGVLR